MKNLKRLDMLKIKIKIKKIFLIGQRIEDIMMEFYLMNKNINLFFNITILLESLP